MGEAEVLDNDDWKHRAYLICPSRCNVHLGTADEIKDFVKWDRSLK